MHVSATSHVEIAASMDAETAKFLAATLRLAAINKRELVKNSQAHLITNMDETNRAILNNACRCDGMASILESAIARQDQHRRNTGKGA